MALDREPHRSLSQPVPLFVDLDGTLIKTDILYESLVSALKKNPFIIFYCFLWILQGKAYLKYQLAEHSDVEISTLPENIELQQFLKRKKEQGKKLILATASAQKYSDKIIQYFHPIFDDSISSSISLNLKGPAKLKQIQALSPVFDYAGNGKEDLIILKHARRKFLVNPSKSTKKKAAAYPYDKVFDEKKSFLRSWIKMMRVHQWSKNFLLFVPLLVSGEFKTPSSFLTVSLGGLCFSALASATYIINDLLDLTADRNHPHKKNRPIAAGKISIGSSLVTAAILLMLSWATAIAIIGENFTWILTAYLSLTLIYSLKIKQYVGMDVIVLAGLYTIRILAGATLIQKPVSFWLLSFSMFIFFSLALLKRCAELKNTDIISSGPGPGGRDYAPSDYPLLLGFGSGSSLLAVLLFCFYSQNNILTNQYQDPSLLWLITPALAYWLMRMWIKTHRGEMHHDPIIFSLTDRGSLVTIILIVLLTILAQLQ